MIKKENYLFFAAPAVGAQGDEIITITTVDSQSQTQTNQDINISAAFDGTTQGVTDDIREVLVVSKTTSTGERGSVYGKLDEKEIAEIGSSFERGSKAEVIYKQALGTFTDRSGYPLAGATQADVVAGQVTILERGAFAVSGSAGSESLRIDKVGQDAVNGYDITAGDVVVIIRSPKANEAVVYPADKFLGISLTSETVSVLHFKSIVGKEKDDTITITHTSGKRDLIHDMMVTALEADPYPGRGNVIKVIDLFNDFVLTDKSSSAVNMGITSAVIAIA